ncbi:MAG: polyprenyl synthetase family protein [Candidatus Heimdallarchaeaceae archaeon]
MDNEINHVRGNQFLTYYYNEVKKFLFSGGKRIRPIFLITAHSAVNPENDDIDSIIQASLSLELLHNASLIHDDIMDNAETRRGEKAFHCTFRDYARKMLFNFNVNSDDFGLAMGILGGDFVYHLAYKAVNVNTIPPDISLRAADEFNKGFLKVVQGVIVETELMGKQGVSEEEYMKMIEGKTAALFETAAKMGGIYGKGTTSQIQSLGGYGRKIGLAFQIVDDIIGLYGNPKKTGKPVDSDLKEGKKTILVIKALEKATDEQKKEMLAVLGNKDASVNEIERVRNIIKETGALNFARKKAETLFIEARKLLEDAEPQFDSTMKKYLIEIGKLGVNREK